MPRQLHDSPYIFGLHDQGGEHLMVQANRRGWIVFTVEVGSDPNDFGGFDFTPWAEQDFGILCRVNNGYGSAGTIPHSSRYAEFARRVANFVAASRGCKLWIIGNEMNHSQEWPAAPSASGAPAPAAMPIPQYQRGPTADPHGRGNPSRFSAITAQQGGLTPASVTPSSTDAGFQPITPELYARCFRQCRDAIKMLAGHGDDQVIVGAVAPWNDQTRYPVNPTGDWVRYFTDILTLLGEGGMDAIALHTYTHGSDPALITDRSTMNPPFENRYFHFQTYRDFMEAVPLTLRHLPIYITETDQDVPWLDQNNGWVQAAYSEINDWNQQPDAQQICCLALYRWPPFDQWHIQGKSGVQNDFLDAMRQDCRWQESSRSFVKSEPVEFQAGDTLQTLSLVNFRQTPGGFVLAQLPANTQVQVVSSDSVQQNGLTWWNVALAPDAGGQAGWLAQVAADGTPLLEKATSTIESATGINIGSQVQMLTLVRMRQTPGITNKSDNDIVADVPPGTTLIVVEGPRSVDGMTWWRNQGTLPDGRQVIGWQAEKLADGTPLLGVLSAPASMVAPVEQPAATFGPGDRFRTLNLVRIRRTAGTSNKSPDDILAAIPPDTQGNVIGGPTASDDMTWWQVAVRTASSQVIQGWMAEALPDGERLMERVATEAATFAKGDLGITLDFANVRRTPGVQGKAADDLLGTLYPRTTVNIISGPVKKDNLIWWRVGSIANTGNEVLGYVAEATPDGQRLLALPPQLSGTLSSSRLSTQSRHHLAAPFDGSYGISQLWGENPAFYSRFNYDGVALQGHNGIDFLTPTGTLLYAVDGGEVLQASFEAGGFGNYILLGHPWGHSLYAHLDSVGVTAGQQVGRGQWIGMSGNSGGSTGPHLHFAIRTNPYQRADGWGGYSDPLPYLPPRSFVLPAYVQDPSSLQIPAALPAPFAQANRHNPPSMGEVSGSQRP